MSKLTAYEWEQLELDVSTAVSNVIHDYLFSDGPSMETFKVAADVYFTWRHNGGGKESLRNLIALVDEARQKNEA